MKLNLPFYTPKQHWETYQLMKSVKPQHDYHKMLKERRHQAYLSHSQIGYKVPQPPKTLKTRVNEFFTRVKDKIKSFDAE